MTTLKLLMTVLAALPFACIAGPAEIQEFRAGLLQMRQGFDEGANQIRSMEKELRELKGENMELQRHLMRLRKQGPALSARSDLRPGQAVSDQCAKYLAAVVILGCEREGKLKDLSTSTREAIVEASREIVGIEAKSALTTSDIPLPTDYAREVVELVWTYGQARKWGTVYPLGTATVKLPRLTTSPAFGFITISAGVPEKSPQIGFVSFAPEKAGGMIRLPREIDMDSIVALGNFIARYCAREMAKWEDATFWTGDGSGTYKSFKGIGKAALDLGKVVQLITTKTKPSDITLNDLRLLRAKVNTQVLQTAGYYMNATMEALLVSFNTSSTVTPYIPRGANGEPTLDGFPVRWVDSFPIYDSSAHVSQLQLTFGEPAYQYLGVRSGIRMETSSDVFFATDEIALRALERFAVGLMADDANAVLQLAAS
jgi:HK97 family phage major capsid protein